MLRSFCSKSGVVWLSWGGGRLLDASAGVHACNILFRRRLCRLCRALLGSAQLLRLSRAAMSGMSHNIEWGRALMNGQRDQLLLAVDVAVEQPDKRKKKTPLLEIIKCPPGSVARL